MNREEALKIARDRLESLEMFQPETESEKATLIETREFLKYVEHILERSKNDNS